MLALIVSRRAPLPARLLRFQEAVRPAAYAMVVLSSPASRSVSSPESS